MAGVDLEQAEAGAVTTRNRACASAGLYKIPRLPRFFFSIPLLTISISPSSQPPEANLIPASLPHLLVTRSHKLNDRDHVALADGTAAAEDHLPRYFAKSGHVDTDPKKTKKDGAGRGNWGRNGDEAQDMGYNMTNPRRRSNSSTMGAKEFKSKFEAREAEPVFEEELHGPIHDDATDDGGEVEKTETADSTTSVEEEDQAIKA
ncbi:MAG: hypothetical protein M1829_003744 [Trizodia sp. TS-e1964]|nr:MAG: hypothetical protein M1829_003744 [Trizodia sp. TS-e1964]